MPKAQVKKAPVPFRIEDVLYRKGRVISEELAWTEGERSHPTYKIEQVRKTPKCNWGIIKRLLEALEHAELKNCGVDKDAQKAMKNYLDTWVVGHIKQAIEAMTIETKYEKR